MERTLAHIVQVENTISPDNANALLADGWELIGVRAEQGPLYVLGLPRAVRDRRDIPPGTAVLDDEAKGRG